MNNFYLYNPTKVFFGKDTIAKLTKAIPKASKIMMLYGGGSIKKNGIYDQVIQALKDHEVIEFGGIPANPEYEKLMEAVDIVKKENIDYLLAVGGGSVIDGTKFVSAAVKYEGDPWEILTQKIGVKEGLPFGTVLTLPATGSEMNYYSVISRRETKEKLSFGGEGVYPQFSILDPNVIKSIPKRQIANGLADAFTHVMEQYMTYPIEGGRLQDRFAEGILHTLVEVAPQMLKTEFDYDAATDFMWSCTMALNGLISKGMPGDWAVHAIGHELTALHGIDHARTLAIIIGNRYEFDFASKKEKLAQYAERIWNITEGSVDEKARKAIEKTRDFYHSLGIDTKLSDYTNTFDGTAEEIERRFTERGLHGIGEHGTLNPAGVKEIVLNSY